MHISLVNLVIFVKSSQDNNFISSTRHFAPAYHIRPLSDWHSELPWQIIFYCCSHQKQPTRCWPSVPWLPSHLVLPHFAPSCVPIATYFISIWREVNCHKQLVACRPHPCRSQWKWKSVGVLPSGRMPFPRFMPAPAPFPAPRLVYYLFTIFSYSKWSRKPLGIIDGPAIYKPWKMGKCWLGGYPFSLLAQQ